MFDYNEFKKFHKNFTEMQSELENFLELFLLEMAERVIARTIQRTPTDTGALRATWGIGSVQFQQLGGTQGWTAQEWQSRGSPDLSAQTPPAEQAVDKDGIYMKVEVFNLMEYSSHVEFGHRTVSGNGFVPGRYMLAISLDEITSQMPTRFSNSWREFMRERGLAE